MSTYPGSPNSTSPAPNTPDQTIYCPHCGELNSINNMQCRSCGEKLLIGQEGRTTHRFAFARSFGVIILICLVFLGLTVITVIAIRQRLSTPSNPEVVAPKEISILPPTVETTPANLKEPQLDVNPPSITPTASSIPSDPVLPAIIPTNTPTTAPSLTFTITLSPTQTLTPTPPPPTQDEPKGKIVFSCVIGDYVQVCLIDLLTKETSQLTSTTNAGSSYPAISPDGKSVLFTSNKTGDHAIYEMDLSTRQERQVTGEGGDKAYPVYSPDGQSIAYADTVNKQTRIYIISRYGGGSDLREIYAGGNRPAWSPDGKQLAFICTMPENQICVINADGDGFRQVTTLADINVKVSWSPDGSKLVFSTGQSETGRRKLCSIRPDGTDYAEIYTEGDAITPSFSPDGGWIVFTGYPTNGQEKIGDIYIIRPDGTDLRRLTKNDRRDLQPFWGP